MESYFNTTNESGKVLDQRISKAENQETIIHELYKKHVFLSPSQVYEYFDPSTPITSIRRAITVLTDKKILVKTENYVQGGYGKREHVYKLIQKVSLQELMAGIDSPLLLELIESYRLSGWNMFNIRDFESHKTEDLKQLIEKGFVKVTSGINSPVIELLHPNKYDLESDAVD